MILPPLCIVVKDMRRNGQRVHSSIKEYISAIFFSNIFQQHKIQLIIVTNLIFFGIGTFGYNLHVLQYKNTLYKLHSNSNGEKKRKCKLDEWYLECLMKLALYMMRAGMERDTLTSRLSRIPPISYS